MNRQPKPSPTASERQTEPNPERRGLRAGLLFSAVIAIVAVAIVAWQTGPGGEKAIESWVGSQITSLIGAYLKPELVFDDLDYQYPGTVVITNARLLADPGEVHAIQHAVADAASTQPAATQAAATQPVATQPASGPTASGPVEILTCRRLSLSLAEIPRPGKPIVIEKISLEAPALRVIAHSPSDPRPIGFSDLLQAAGDPDDSSAEKPKSGLKLSNFFRIRLIDLVSGSLLYDPRVDGVEPMHIEGIATQLRVTPTDDGWYNVEVNEPNPVFGYKVLGRLNIDTHQLDISEASLQLRLGPDQDRYLPPQLQKLRQQFGVGGTLTANAHGMLELMAALESNVEANFQLDGLTARYPPFQLDGLSARGEALYADSLARMPEFLLQVFGGEFRAQGEIRLSEVPQTEASFELANLDVQKIMAAGVSKFLAQSQAPAASDKPGDEPAAPTYDGGGLVAINDGRFVLSGTDPFDARAQAVLKADDAWFRQDESRYEMPKARVELSLADRQARADAIAAEAFGGQITGYGHVLLNPTLDATMAIQTETLDVAHLAAGVDGKSPVDGLLNARTEIKAPLTAWNTQADGGGQVAIRRGRLEQLPILSQITALARGNKDKPPSELSEKQMEKGDQVDAAFAFEGNRMELTDIKVKTDLILLEGVGRVYFDQNLHMRFKGGALERITDRVGKIPVLNKVGDAIGKVGSALTTYKVDGTLQSPKVKVVPGGTLDMPKPKQGAAKQSNRRRRGRVNNPTAQALKNLFGGKKRDKPKR